MQEFKSVIDFIVTDMREARRLVSLKLSTIATAIGGLILANQQFLLQLIDRVADHVMRNAIIGGVLFLVIFVPSLKSEFSPVPKPVPTPPAAPDADR